MRRVLSWLGLCPDPSYRQKQESEDIETMARLDYLDWLAYRWPAGVLWAVDDA